MWKMYEKCFIFLCSLIGTDGKAGMLCVAGQDDRDVSQLYGILSRHLPSYAVPVFLRFTKELDLTGKVKWNGRKKTRIFSNAH